MTRKQVELKIGKVKKELRVRFNVEALYVFGSVATGKSTSTSDVDVIVDFVNDETSLFEFLDLKAFLENALGAKVDLVTRDAIKSSMIAEIEKQAVRVA